MGKATYFSLALYISPNIHIHCFLEKQLLFFNSLEAYKTNG